MTKLFGLFLLALACWAPASSAYAVGCFWVGGTGSINDTTHWSSASGGTVSTCGAPGGWPNSISDSATFDASSGGGTITRNVAWTVSTLNISAFTGTFGNSGDSAAVQLFTWTNNGSGTRTVNMGTSTWTCIPGCSWSQIGATNLTFNANTSTILFTTSTNATTFANLGVFTYNVVTFTGGTIGGAISMTTGNTTIGTWNISGPIYIQVNNGANLPVTTLNVTGGGPTAWVSFFSSAITNAFTVTLTNPASCNYCAFRDMTAVTSAITATNSIDNGRNTNISISPPSAGGGGGGRIIGG